MVGFCEEAAEKNIENQKYIGAYRGHAKNLRNVQVHFLKYWTFAAIFTIFITV